MVNKAPEVQLFIAWYLFSDEFLVLRHDAVVLLYCLLRLLLLLLLLAGLVDRLGDYACTEEDKQFDGSMKEMNSPASFNKYELSSTIQGWVGSGL
jgi:hypothetical protein